MALCEGKFVVGAVVELEARCECDDVGVVVAATPLSHLYTNVIHPVCKKGQTNGQAGQFVSTFVKHV